MPDRCCVTGCKSNYDSSTGGYVTVFRFPQDDVQRKLWLKKIPRKDWSPGPTSKVCSLHFDEKFISRHEEYIDANREKKVALRKRPILLPNAVPTIFPNLPSYLSFSTTQERTAPEKRRKICESRHEKAVAEFLANDIISDFNTLVRSYMKHVTGPWKFEIGSNFIAYMIDFSNNNPKITSSIEIDAEMRVEVHRYGYRMPAADLNWLFDNNNNKLVRWSQFENLLKRIEVTEEGSGKPSKIFAQEATLTCIQQLIKVTEDVESLITLNFLQSQFQLLCCGTKSARRYSPEMIVNSFMINMLSPACYDALRNNSLLILPHQSRLIQLTQNLSASVEDVRKNRHFLKQKVDTLTDLEKYVVMQIDEIYVKCKIDYKNGKLYGYAENGPESKVTPARTIYAVFASSAFSDFKEVVSLRPVNKISATELKDIVEDTAELLREIGLKVIIIASDNNAVNRKLFDELCGKGNYITIKQMYEGGKTFCTFDSVHLVKSIRNNWLNTKGSEKTFVYPHFEDLSKICFAEFSILRKIYEKEKFLLIKTAPRLNYKTVYPSNIERQKVNLALNVFHESTVAAVKEHAGKQNETAVFLEIISTWWNIMNIKNTHLHILKRNDTQKPFYTVDDDRLTFLENFLLWLTRWKPVKDNPGFLTDETYKALYRQVQVMIQFIKYALVDLKVPFILTGKVQTDNLEKRFGRYRSLAGNNYNISVVQVLESEKKLRLTSLLGLKSARYGEIKYHPSSDIVDDPVNVSDENIDPKELSLFDEFFDDFHDEFFNSIDPVNSNSGLIFVCGYVSFKLKTKLNCEVCLEKFLSKERTGNEYFQEIDRGGLSVPTDLCLQIGKLAHLLMKVLISEKYESKFVTCTNQRTIFMYFLEESLFLLDYNYDEKCTICETIFVEYFRVAFKIFSNILLNNYSKMKNNIHDSATKTFPSSSGDKSKNNVRKLSTLKK